MPRKCGVSFIDDELQAFLPDAFELYHIDHIGATWKGKKLDWAWQESDRFFLCELKDPECIGAREHNPDAVEEVRSMWAEREFPSVFAQKVHDTIPNNQACTNSVNRTLIVLIAITALTVIEMQTAAFIIERDIASLGVQMPVIVVNLEEWNEVLRPRTIVRLTPI